jgi:hypothetical protein
MIARRRVWLVPLMIGCSTGPTGPSPNPEVIETSWVGIGVPKGGGTGVFIRVDLRESASGSDVGDEGLLVRWSGESFTLSTATQPNRKWTAISPLWWAGRGPIVGDRNGGTYQSQVAEESGHLTMFPRGAELVAYCGTLAGADASGAPMAGAIGVLRRGAELRGVYFGSQAEPGHYWGYFTATASPSGSPIEVAEFPRVTTESRIVVTGSTLAGSVHWEAGGEVAITASPCTIPPEILE